MKLNLYYTVFIDRFFNYNVFFIHFDYNITYKIKIKNFIIYL